MKGRMEPISSSENKVVTWVVYESKHVVIPGIRPLCEAFDVAVIKNNVAIWDLKVSVNDDTIPDYEQLAKAGQKVGLESGSEWKTKDWPHYQKRG